MRRIVWFEELLVVRLEVVHEVATSRLIGQYHGCLFESFSTRDFTHRRSLCCTCFQKLILTRS